MRRGRRAGRAGIVVVCVATLAAGIGLAGSGDAKPSEHHLRSRTGRAPPVHAPSRPRPRPRRRAARLPRARAADELKRGRGRPRAPAAAGRRGSNGGPHRPSVSSSRPSGRSRAHLRPGAVTILVAAPLDLTARRVTFTIDPTLNSSVPVNPAASRILRAGDNVGFGATRTGKVTATGWTQSTPIPAAASAPAPAGRGATREAGSATRRPNSRRQRLPGRGSGVAGRDRERHRRRRTRRRARTVRLLGHPRQPVRGPTAAHATPPGFLPGPAAGFNATRTGPAAYRLDQVNLTVIVGQSQKLATSGRTPIDDGVR